MPDVTSPRAQPGSPANASRNLLVVSRQGDEALLYGALLSEGAGQAWDALLVFGDHPDAVARVPGTSSTHRLDLPMLPARDLDPAAASARMRSMLAGYGRTFVPNLGRDNPPSVIAAALAGIAHEGELWARSVDDPDAPFQSLPARHLARHLVGFHAHFVDAPAWRALVLRDDPDPWGLAASAYEADRHALELEVLAGLDWRSLVEVGPCRGTFTARLAARFPGRPILAVEPDPSFAASVRGLGLPGVEVVEASALEVEPAVDRPAARLLRLLPAGLAGSGARRGAAVRRYQPPAAVRGRRRGARHDGPRLALPARARAAAAPGAPRRPHGAARRHGGARLGARRLNTATATQAGGVGGDRSAGEGKG